MKTNTAVAEKPATKTKLKGVAPEKLEKRLKLFLYAPAGVGKTTAAIQFPNAYIIDTERGCENYGQTIKESGSVVFQSNDPSEIREQLEALLIEDHPFKTLVIDPVTVLYQSIQDAWTRRFETEAREKSKSANADMQDFGMRYWGKVKSDYKAIQRLLIKLDMNVIITAHQKDVYGSGFNKIGVTYDSMKGDDYFFDNVFRLEKRGKQRIAITEKERCEVGRNKFPEEFEWSYSNFLKFYGEVIEKKAQAVAMATKEHVARIHQLLTTVKVADDWQDKLFTKADVDDWSEMTADQITKCLDVLEKKLLQIEQAKGE